MSAEQKEELLNTLNNCLEYFDSRSDADHDGIGFIANAEMKLMMEVKEAIKILESLP